MTPGLGFCVWLTARKTHPWWVRSKLLSEETGATPSVRPHVRIVERANSVREAALSPLPPVSSFRVEDWLPRQETELVADWPPLHRIVFPGTLGPLEVAQRFGEPFSDSDLQSAARIFSEAPVDIYDPIKIIVRAHVPSTKKWRDVSP